MFRGTDLPKVTSVSFLVAKAFHNEYKFKPLSLDGVKQSSNMSLRMLAQRPGSLSLNGLEKLNPATASYFANHTGGVLSLRGLVELDDECAGYLAKKQNRLYLSRRTRISEKGLASLLQGTVEITWDD